MLTAMPGARGARGPWSPGPIEALVPHLIIIRTIDVIVYRLVEGLLGG